MSKLLVLRPVSPTAAVCQWARLGPPAGARASGEDAWEALPTVDAGERVVLLLPAEDLLFAPLELAARGADLARAAPYALEERLPAEPERYHVAIGPRLAAGHYRVAAILHERLQAYLERCRVPGLQVEGGVPEPLALPLPAAGVWSVLIDRQRLLVRTALAEGFACPLEQAPVYLAAAARAHGGPPEVLDVSCVGAPSADALQPAEWTDTEQRTHRLMHWAEAVDPQALRQPPLDLLQGPYGARRSGTGLRRWRWALAAVAAWGVLALTLTLLEQARLREQVDALQAQAVEIYRTAVPEARRVVAPRLQMQQALAAAGRQAHEPLFSLLAASGPALSGVPGVEVESLGYRPGQLDMVLRLPDAATLEVLQEALRAEGLTADVLTASTGEAQTTAQLRVREMT